MTQKERYIEIEIFQLTSISHTSLTAHDLWPHTETDWY